MPLAYLLHDVTPLCPRLTRLDRDGRACHRAQGVGCVTGGCWRPGEQGRWASDAHGLLMRTLQVRAMRSVPQWIVPSRYLAELLQLHGVADAGAVAVVPHFIGPADAPVPPPVPGRLFFAGRLVPEKGLQVLIDALPHLHAAHWHLHVAGDGPSREALQAQAHRLGLGERVRWLGALPPHAMAEQYGQATAVVMPSLIPESFGLVGLEAMRSARPVAGFLSGGMAEWLRDGVNGVVAAWGDARSLAGAIDPLLMQPSVAAALGERGRALALREFSPALHLQRLQRLLERTIDAHGRPADRVSPPRPTDTRAARP
ncbi:glycosyltransferase [Aquabacterium sp. J223]|uniref:glycosyltransferase n=1 Tax=Aquabacterium sp. J223 TaxID=2898431 RepID=UPI0021ADD385|nr:glycosyltransferase [Aquabacterium sp. J223]UUX94795.1 glycosyltransferase [Aquabacterium sp. J223]